MAQGLSMEQINRILEVTDRLGLHREKVTIPLMARTPGAVRRARSGKLEIVVDASQDFEAWLAGLEAEVRQFLG